MYLESAAGVFSSPLVTFKELPYSLLTLRVSLCFPYVRILTGAIKITFSFF
jgi:hypothetical protein